MKHKHLPWAFAIPLVMTLGIHYCGNQKVYRVESDCHPSFSLELSGNQIKCYEDGLSRPALTLESSLGNGIYDKQKADPASTCAQRQCHPRPGPVDGETLLKMAEGF